MVPPFAVVMNASSSLEIKLKTPENNPDDDDEGGFRSDMPKQ